MWLGDILNAILNTFRSKDLIECQTTLENRNNFLRQIEAENLSLYAEKKSLETKLNEEKAKLFNKIKECQLKESEYIDLSDEYEELSKENLELEKELKNQRASDIETRPVSPILRIPKQKEHVYNSGFRIKYQNRNQTYEFKKHCASILVGGVAFDYILDSNYYTNNMTSKEVFDKSLEIVQTKFGYQTDNSLYQQLDSWASPLLTQTFHYGDCDDLSAFVISLYLTYEQVYGVLEDTPAIAIGYLTKGSMRECHAFPVLFGKDLENSYIGEATLSYAKPSKPITELKENYSMDYGIITHSSLEYLDGGFIMTEDTRYWEHSGSDTEEEEPNPKGKKKKKEKATKDIWD